MNTDKLIPNRVYLMPLSRSLIISDIDTINEDGELIPKEDRGYSWVVTEKDPGRCNPEFINVENLWHKPSEKPKLIKKGMLSVGCFVRYKYGDFGYAEYWFAPFDKWQDPIVSDDIKLEDIESWCYVIDLLPKGGDV